MASRDWKSLAGAVGLQTTGKQLADLVRPLELLQDTFQPLTVSLPPDLEPVLYFCAEADGE